MSDLFSGGSSAPVYIPTPPPPPPSIDDATGARESADAVRRRKGRASTILTKGKDSGEPRTSAKTLLGG